MVLFSQNVPTVKTASEKTKPLASIMILHVGKKPHLSTHLYISVRLVERDLCKTHVKRRAWNGLVA